MKTSLEDYTRVVRGRYARRTGKQARRALLDEYCQVTGFERKYAIKVLRGQRRREASGKPRGACSRYSPADLELLKMVWLEAGQPCGKRLAGSMLELWLDSWQRNYGVVARAQVRRIAGISAAQIDREMAAYRSAGRKRRVASGALAAMQREVAVRCEPWVESAPGAIEIDTVALCGGSMAGAIVWALDATDIHSGWTEVRAVWNRGGYATCQRMSQIEEALPFAIRKLDFDNGSEFLNAHFIRHFKEHEPKIELSRSRPYRKNDNAHVEQKNYTHVRLILGDDRFEHQQLVEALNEALRLWSLWNNLYSAQRRLLSKERRADGKVVRHHEKRASTPCARLLARKDLSTESRAKLAQLLKDNDPIELRKKFEAKLKAVYALREQLQRADQEDEETGSAEAKPTPPPGGDRAGRLGHEFGRSVAYGSFDSLHSSPNLPARSGSKAVGKTRLQKPILAADSRAVTVSSTVRHRAHS